MNEAESGKRGFHELGEQIFGANFYEARRLGDDFGFARFGANGENPARAIEAPLIENVAIAEVFSGQDQRNLDAV